VELIPSRKIWPLLQLLTLLRQSLVADGEGGKDKWMHDNVGAHVRW